MSQLNRVNEFGLFSNHEIFNRNHPHEPQEILKLLGISPRNSAHFLESLPFSLNDTTAGSENELQAVVEGTNNNVDLSITIEQSNYFRNVQLAPHAPCARCCG